MKLIELDSHPLMESFRLNASELVAVPGEIYHLLLPPEYNLLGGIDNPLEYLFVENQKNLNIFVQYTNHSAVLKCEENFLIPSGGFDHNQQIEILQTTPCTTSNGFSFDMHEIGSNPFLPSPIPPLCYEIDDGYQNPQSALKFLKTRIRSEKIRPLIDEIEIYAQKTPVNTKNYNKIVSYIHESMDKICDYVFEVRPFQFVPTVFKMKTNFIIFYAITSLFHNKLLKAYHDALTSENIAAQRATKISMGSIGSPEILDKAATYIRNLHHMKSVYEGIEMVKQFFECAVSSIPGNQAAADDILPAICDGLGRCAQISSHIASSFQYLVDLWPQGLSERTTYIIITCSIAASHFASGNEQKAPPKPKEHVIVVNKKQTEETINLLESFLNTI